MSAASTMCVNGDSVPYTNASMQAVTLSDQDPDFDDVLEPLNDTVFHSTRYVLANVSDGNWFSWYRCGFVFTQLMDDRVWTFKIAVPNEVMQGSIYVPDIDEDHLEYGLDALQPLCDLSECIGTRTMTMDSNVPTCPEFNEHTPFQKRIAAIQSTILQAYQLLSLRKDSRVCNPEDSGF